MIIGDCRLDIWNGWEKRLPGGDIALIRGRGEIVDASWLARWLCENIAILGGPSIDVRSYEISREENIFFQYTERIMPDQGTY